MNKFKINLKNGGSVVMESQIERLYDTEIQLASNNKITITKTGYSTKEKNDGLITINNNGIIEYGLQECKREATYRISIETIIRKAFCQLMKYLYNEINEKHREPFKVFLITTEESIYIFYYKDIEIYIDDIFDLIEQSINLCYTASRVGTFKPLRDYLNVMEFKTLFFTNLFRNKVSVIDDDFNMKTFIQKI